MGISYEDESLRRVLTHNKILKQQYVTIMMAAVGTYINMEFINEIMTGKSLS